MIASPSRPRSARWGVPTLALAALLLAALLPISATAAPATGQATIVAQPGQAKTDLLAQGAKLRGGAKGKAGRATLPVTDLRFGKVTRAELAGRIVFNRGKRRAVARDLSVRVAGKQSLVVGTVGKQTLAIFRAAGQSESVANTIGLSKAPLALTGNAAKALAPRLGLDKVKPGRLGLLSLNAIQNDLPKKEEEPKKEEPKPNLDPYFAQCGISATSQATGTLPEPADLPTLVDSKSVVGPAAIPWPIKASFNNYVVNVSSGSIHTAAGASQADGAFQFPHASGEYAINDALDMTDDQAIVNGSGTVIFCAPGKFRIAISNPTLVIDGEDSRIVADFDTNVDSVWTPDQRADFLELNLEGITPFYNHSGSEVTWDSIPAKLSDTGAEALCGGDENCPYAAGTPFDPVSMTVQTPYDLGAGDETAWNALASYVGANLPFPLPDPALGGCEVGLPAGGSTTNARTVDEYHGYWTGTPTNPQTAWNSNAAQATAPPNLSGKTAVEGGSLKWGFRTGLRNSLNSTGDYNLANGATASGEYFGNGGTLGARPSLLGAGAFFTWPAVAGGRYDAGEVGSADDRLELRTQGRVAFCQVQSAQRYAAIFTNPTVVIDGSSSRITIDVLSRYRLSWVRGVVDFASIDLSGGTFASNTAGDTTTVTWTDAPVTLTANGAKVVGLLSPATYVAGATLDPATISASFPAGP